MTEALDVSKIPAQNRRIRIEPVGRGEGWAPAARTKVIEACKRYSLPFLDICAVVDSEMDVPSIVLSSFDSKGKPTVLPQGYVFFAHYKMCESIPFDTAE